MKTPELHEGRKLTGSLDGYWRAEKNNLASYGQTEKEAVELLKELIRRIEK